MTNEEIRKRIEMGRRFIKGVEVDEEYIFYAMPVGTIREKDRAKEKEHYRFVEEEGY